MKQTEIIANEIAEGLCEFMPTVVEFGEDTVVGVPNDINNNDLVIYIKENELVLTFGYQNAHFAPQDIKDCILHARKYLTSEYASVEFFYKEKDLFGGSRYADTVNFDTVEGIVNCYSAGNEKAAQGLYEFLKNNSGVTVRAVTFDNSLNDVVEVKYNGKDFILNRMPDKNN